MKKSIVFLSALVIGAISFQACDKEDQHQPPVVTNINQNLSKNQSYTFILPANLTKEEYRIETSPNHASLSLVSKDANGNETYQYTPELNYVGEDLVKISNVHKEECESNHHPFFKRHHRDNDEEDQQLNIVNINFNIGSETRTIDK